MTQEGIFFAPKRELPRQSKKELKRQAQLQQQQIEGGSSSAGVDGGVSAEAGDV